MMMMTMIVVMMKTMMNMMFDKPRFFFFSIQFSCKAPGGRTKLGRDSSHCPRCADHQFPLPTWDDSRLVLIWFVMVWNIFYFPCIENNNPN